MIVKKEIDDEYDSSFSNNNCSRFNHIDREKNLKILAIVLSINVLLVLIAYITEYLIYWFYDRFNFC